MLRQSTSSHITSSLAEELVEYIKSATMTQTGPNKYEHISSSSLEQILEFYTDASVVELNFLGVTFSWANSLAFTEVLEQLAKARVSVTGLKFTDCKIVETFNEFKLLLSEIMKCTKLNKLSFQETDIGYRYVVFLLEMMVNTELKGIDYSVSEYAAGILFRSIKDTTDTHLRPYHIDDLPEMVTNTELTIVDYSITSSLDKELVEFVKNTYLRLTENGTVEINIPSSSLEQIFECYPDASVVELDFVSVDFDLLGVGFAFEEVLYRLDKAGISIGLNFRSCNVGVSMEEILSAIKKCTKLNKLSFQDTYIELCDIEKLPEIVANTELTRIDYSTTTFLAGDLPKDSFDVKKPRALIYLSSFSYPLPETVPINQTNYLFKKIGEGLGVHRAFQYVLSIKYKSIDIIIDTTDIPENVRHAFNPFGLEKICKWADQTASLVIKSYPRSKTLDLNEVDAAKPTASTTFIPAQTGLSDSGYTFFNSPQPPASAEYMPPVTPSRVAKPDTSSEIESYQNLPS